MPRKKPPKKQTTIKEFSGYRQKRKNDNSLVVHIALKKIKLSNSIKEIAKTKMATSKSPPEVTDNDNKHLASSEKRFKTKAEMKVGHYIKDHVMYWNVFRLFLSFMAPQQQQWLRQHIAVKTTMKYIL